MDGDGASSTLIFLIAEVDEGIPETRFALVGLLGLFLVTVELEAKCGTEGLPSMVGITPLDFIIVDVVDAGAVEVVEFCLPTIWFLLTSWYKGILILVMSSYFDNLLLSNCLLLFP